MEQPNQLMQHDVTETMENRKPFLTRDKSGSSSPVLLEHKNEIYYNLWRRWKVKKKIYNGSAILFKRIDMIMFVFPLLLLQLAIVILPMVIDAELSKFLATGLAAVSSVWIGAQQKLRWGEKGEKYAATAVMYAHLTSEAYFQITVSAVDPDSASNQNVLKFLDHAQKLEENTRSSCPLPPNCIADKYNRQEDNSMVTDH